MQFETTKIPEVVLVRPKIFGDRTSQSVESWNSRTFSAAGLDQPFVQDNHSRSIQYTIRGLHYQIRQPQGRLLHVVSGTVFNVAVDLRRSSITFGKSVSVVLSDQNHYALWVPPGFAHGFLVLSEFAEILQRCTQFWLPTAECTIAWDDPTLNISWPLPSGRRPVLSVRDATASPFVDAHYFP